MKPQKRQTETLSLLFEHAESIKYNKGEIICKQGAIANQLMLITDGYAKIYIEHKRKNIILRFLCPTEVIGLHNLFQNKNFIFSGAAITDCVVKVLSFSDMQKVLDVNHDIKTEIIEELNRYSLSYFQRFISLTQKQLHGRMADAILHLAEDVYQSTHFELHLTRKDIAEYTAMSTESAIRILKEFHNDRIIELEGKSLSIVSKALLFKLSDLG